MTTPADELVVSALAKARASLLAAEKRLAATSAITIIERMLEQNKITTGWLAVADLELRRRRLIAGRIPKDPEVAVFDQVETLEASGARGVQLSDFEYLVGLKSGVSVDQINAELERLVGEGVLLPFADDDDGGYYPFPPVEGVGN